MPTRESTRTGRNGPFAFRNQATPQSAPVGSAPVITKDSSTGTPVMQTQRVPVPINTSRNTTVAGTANNPSAGGGVASMVVSYRPSPHRNIKRPAAIMPR